MNLAKILTRRAAVAAALAALGLPQHAEADRCTKKCNDKKDKDARQKCREQCKRKKKRQLPPPPPPVSPPPPPDPPVRQTTSFTGFGPQVTEGQTMIAGRYLAIASIAPTRRTHFIVYIHGPESSPTLVVNKIVKPGSPQRFERVITLGATGIHFLEARNASGSWGVTFSPI
jgi:hypothetical protein